MTYGVLMDASTKEETTPTTTTAVVNGGSKPVKKVEFCKTEIHFAADSGKVNIVETDGKPPPTNKFRRRRRNSSVGAAASNNAQVRFYFVKEDFNGRGGRGWMIVPFHTCCVIRLPLLLLQS